MADFIVTNVTDAVDPDDGELSLREAIAVAASPGADVIRFADGVVRLPTADGPWAIAAGEDPTILADAGPRGTAPRPSTAWARPAPGSPPTVSRSRHGRGSSSRTSCPWTAGRRSGGTSGAAGSASGRGADGGNGGDAARSIFNRGEVELERVVIDNARAEGGGGGAGGVGGAVETGACAAHGALRDPSRGRRLP